MIFTKTENTYIIKIEKGEDVIASLTDLCVQEGVSNGYFRGIGAVEHISCGYYDLAEKEYYFKEYTGLFEVISASGNVALKDGEPFIHLHAVFSDEGNSTFGGHIEEMRVGIVLEVILEVLPTEIKREYDQEIGLFLMKCDR